MLRVLYVVLLMMVSHSVVSETIEEAILRSGSLIVSNNFPPVLEANTEYTFKWKIQSYVPLKSRLEIRYSDGTIDRELGNKLIGPAESAGYSIGSYGSYFYEYSVNYTVRNVSDSNIRIGFHNTKDDNGSDFWMYGLYPVNSVDRPYRTSGKQFLRNSCQQNVSGGQCVSYVRNYFGGSYVTMPGLCAHADCGAHHSYDDWDLGFGKGVIPKANSIMVIDDSNALPVGHVAVVVGVKDNNNGTYTLTIQESNWDLDENVDCGVAYTFNAQTLQVSREGGAQRDVRGFIYSDKQ